jgi:DNA primase small subunit
MGKTVGLKGNERDFCIRSFSDYFRNNPLEPPPELERRELAFALFEDAAGNAPFLRHRSLRTKDSLNVELASLVPRHVYYSTSLYKAPSNPSMKEKGWEGADIAFDLDADHLLEASTMQYAEQLELARKRFAYLLDEYLMGDFGLTESDFTIAFSGGRGYHAHVHAPAFQRMTGGERRELVDYIMGIGFDPETDSFGHDYGPRSEGGRGIGRQYLRLFSSGEPGWRGRMSRGIQRWLEERKALSEEELAQEVLKLLERYETQPSDGGAPVQEDPSAKRKRAGRAKRIAMDLARPETQKAILERQTLESFPHDKTGENRKELLGALARALSVPLQGEMDAPVTTDVHRLIRMPGSLHGGTGFIVRTLSRNDLDSFNPFVDALIKDTHGPTRVKLAKMVDYPFRDPPLKGQEGEILSIPAPQALFLMLRGEATLDVD